MRRALALIAVCCILIGCSNNLPDDQGTEVGDYAPMIKTQAEDGHQVNLSQLKGSYVIVEFYASWCGPCHRELPKLKRLYDQQKKSSNPVEVISIALEKNKKTGLKFLNQIDFPWSHQIVNESRFVRFDPIASRYGVSDIPASFLIGPDGKLLASYSSIDELALILDSL